MTIVSAAYSRRADEYIELLGSVGAVHVSDRHFIDKSADTTTGRVLDAGCGPGHWTDHLARRGLAVRGTDLVPAFIEHARRTYPDVAFDIGDLDDIDERDARLGGVLSWFSTIHHAPDRIWAPIAEIARVLRPDGGPVLGFFTGSRVERFDHAVTTAHRWPASTMRGLLLTQGFEVIRTHRRSGPDTRPVATLECRRTAAPIPGRRAPQPATLQVIPGVGRVVGNAKRVPHVCPTSPVPSREQCA